LKPPDVGQVFLDFNYDAHYSAPSCLISAQADNPRLCDQSSRFNLLEHTTLPRTPPPRPFAETAVAESAGQRSPDYSVLSTASYTVDLVTMLRSCNRNAQVNARKYPLIPISAQSSIWILRNEDSRPPMTHYASVTQLQQNRTILVWVIG